MMAFEEFATAAYESIIKGEEEVLVGVAKERYDSFEPPK